MIRRHCSGSKARAGIHHLDQVLVALLALLGCPGLDEHEEGGDSVDHHGEHGHPVAPAGVVVVGVEEPLPVPAHPPEQRHAEEDDGGHDGLHDEVDQDQAVLKPVIIKTYLEYNNDLTI